MSIYILCGVILALAFPLAWWLKREGERSFARHQEMIRQARQREAMVRVTIAIRDNLTPAFQRLEAEIRAMGPVLAKAAAAIREASPS
jgi:hypothetical protein